MWFAALRRQQADEMQLFEFEEDVRSEKDKLPPEANGERKGQAWTSVQVWRDVLFQFCCTNSYKNKNAWCIC